MNVIDTTDGQVSQNDSGMEFLKELIKSNNHNAEMCKFLSSRIDDLEIKLGSFELTIDSAHACYKEANDFSSKEQIKRGEFLKAIPNSIDVNFPESAIQYLEDLRKKSSYLRTIFYGAIISSIISIITIVFISNLAIRWYQASIRSKEEMRTEVLKNIDSEGKTVTEKSYLEKLENNTKLMQSWIKTNSKGTKDFQKFRAGFEAK